MGFRRIGLPCFEPKGAFYMFPDISGSGLCSEEFCERFLLEEKGSRYFGHRVRSERRRLRTLLLRSLHAGSCRVADASAALPGKDKEE
jgi:aspartate/methionine/tyrosine aminotransferase